MKLRTALELGRVASVPTVTTNVVAAIALAGAHPGGVTIAMLCLALSAMYVAGMFLNDAFDRDHDRVARRDRPIPAGDVAAAIVFDTGFVLLGGGIVLVAATALAAGAGWKPLVSAVALGSLIIFYDANHRGSRFAPLLMGLCRACVYTTAALVVRRDLCLEVLLGAAVLAAYQTGVFTAARQTGFITLREMAPLALIVMPVALARPDDTFSLAIYTAFMLWGFRALVLLRMRRVAPAIAGLVDGIALLDALLAANMGRPKLALAAVAAFAATQLLRRIVP